MTVQSPVETISAASWHKSVLLLQRVAIFLPCGDIFSLTNVNRLCFSEFGSPGNPEFWMTVLLRDCPAAMLFSTAPIIMATLGRHHHVHDTAGEMHRMTPLITRRDARRWATLFERRLLSRTATSTDHGSIMGAAAASTGSKPSSPTYPFQADTTTMVRSPYRFHRYPECVPTAVEALQSIIKLQKKTSKDDPNFDPKGGEGSGEVRWERRCTGEQVRKVYMKLMWENALFQLHDSALPAGAEALWDLFPKASVSTAFSVQATTTKTGTIQTTEIMTSEDASSSTSTSASTCASVWHWLLNKGTSWCRTNQAQLEWLERFMKRNKLTVQPLTSQAFLQQHQTVLTVLGRIRRCHFSPTANNFLDAAEDIEGTSFENLWSRCREDSSYPVNAVLPSAVVNEFQLAQRRHRERVQDDDQYRGTSTVFSDKTCWKLAANGVSSQRQTGEDDDHGCDGEKVASDLSSTDDDLWDAPVEKKQKKLRMRRSRVSKAHVVSIEDSEADDDDDTTAGTDTELEAIDPQAAEARRRLKQERRYRHLMHHRAYAFQQCCRIQSFRPTADDVDAYLLEFWPTFCLMKDIIKNLCIDPYGVGHCMSMKQWALLPLGLLVFRPSSFWTIPSQVSSICSGLTTNMMNFALSWIGAHVDISDPVFIIMLVLSPAWLLLTALFVADMECDYRIARQFLVASRLFPGDVRTTMSVSDDQYEERAMEQMNHQLTLRRPIAPRLEAVLMSTASRCVITALVSVYVSYLATVSWSLGVLAITVICVGLAIIAALWFVKPRTSLIRRLLPILVLSAILWYFSFSALDFGFYLVGSLFMKSMSFGWSLLQAAWLPAVWVLEAAMGYAVGPLQDGSNGWVTRLLDSLSVVQSALSADAASLSAGLSTVALPEIMKASRFHTTPLAADAFQTTLWSSTPMTLSKTIPGGRADMYQWAVQLAFALPALVFTFVIPFRQPWMERKYTYTRDVVVSPAVSVQFWIRAAMEVIVVYVRCYAWFIVAFAAHMLADDPNSVPASGISTTDTWTVALALGVWVASQQLAASWIFSTFRCS